MKRAHEMRTYLRACFAGEEPSGLGDELKSCFGCDFAKGAFDFRTQINKNYDVDVNNMLRVTLAPFFGKESELKRIAERFGVTFVLEIVPELYASGDDPTPILSLDSDIIKFLYLSGAQHDLDLYVLS